MDEFYASENPHRRLARKVINGIISAAINAEEIGGSIPALKRKESKIIFTTNAQTAIRKKRLKALFGWHGLQNVQK